MLTIKSGIVQGTSINSVPFRAMIIKSITKKHRPMIPMSRDIRSIMTREFVQVQRR